MNQTTRGPWTIADDLPDKTTIIGADGFPIGFAYQIAILPRYDEKLRIVEWQPHPGKAYVTRPIEESRSNASLFAASNELRDACELFTAAAYEVRDLLNAKGLACPASIAIAAEKARNAIKAASR